MARGNKRGDDAWSRRHSASDADLTPPPVDPLAEESLGGEPFDLAAVQRDDALLDALSGGGSVPTTSAEEYRLATLLAGWRADIVEPEMPAGPSLDEVAAAVDAEIARTRSQRSHRPTIRLLRPIAGAAAAIAVVMAGATVFSYNAVPGDPLWKVKEVVFSERANSTVASIDTANNLQEAERMIRSGDPQGARAELESASRRVGAVSDAGKRDELNAWHARLLADVTAAAPGTPQPTTTTTTPGVTTTAPAPTTTLPVLPPPTTSPHPVPSEVLTVPVESTLPSVTLPPVTSTVAPPVTTVPSPEPETGTGAGADTGTGSAVTPTAISKLPLAPASDSVSEKSSPTS